MNEQRETDQLLDQFQAQVNQMLDELSEKCDLYGEDSFGDEFAVEIEKFDQLLKVDVYEYGPGWFKEVFESLKRMRELADNWWKQ